MAENTLRMHKCLSPSSTWTSIVDQFPGLRVGTWATRQLFIAVFRASCKVLGQEYPRRSLELPALCIVNRAEPRIETIADFAIELMQWRRINYTSSDE